MIAHNEPELTAIEPVSNDRKSNAPGGSAELLKLAIPLIIVSLSRRLSPPGRMAALSCLIVALLATLVRPSVRPAIP